MTDFLKISLVTTTFNSEAYLEATIQSVLRQNYPNLEYIIMDGASKDGTVEIIRKYEKHLAYWQSEPDKGMYEGIQKGFAKSTGTIMAWLNSDDMYPEWALHTVNRIFQDVPQAEWITSIRPMIWNIDGHATDCMALAGYSKRGFLQGEHMPNNPHFAIESIQQESTFWTRSLWERAGGSLDTSLRLGGDYELWARFYQHAELYGVRTVLSGFRIHGEQASQKQIAQYNADVQAVNQRYGVKVHSPQTGFLRKHIAPHMPRRLAYRLGIAHASPIITYEQATQKWTSRTVYI